MPNVDALTSVRTRRRSYRNNIPYVFKATAGLYYRYWGEFFHLAVFEDGDDSRDVAAAFARTHERYFHAINGPCAARILELACGGGAFTEWMARRTSGEVVGMDISEAQLVVARRRKARPNLRFVEQDIMRIDEWAEPPFDAAVCLDAACYLPDKGRALARIATRLTRGARLLLVDWCRAESLTALQQELIFEPFYRAWGIPDLETTNRYQAALAAAGFRLVEVDDLSPRVTPNWQRAYDAAHVALAEPSASARFLTKVARTFGPGQRALQLVKDQYQAVLLIKAAADVGVLRYVAFVCERI